MPFPAGKGIGDVARGERRAQEVRQPAGDIGDAAPKQKVNRLVIVAACGQRIRLRQQDLRGAGVWAPGFFVFDFRPRALPRQPPGDAFHLKEDQKQDDCDARYHRPPEQIDHVGTEPRQKILQRFQPLGRLRRHIGRQVELDRFVGDQLLVQIGQPFGFRCAWLCHRHPLPCNLWFPADTDNAAEQLQVGWTATTNLGRFTTGAASHAAVRQGEAS
ncbi:hypothetical protein [Mesorhizobium sp. M0767]|uniref:hypothetical protein n=1 Tax=Mesorhizobium sp. M0767 TaxID=2956995 RepID=UPI0033386063